MDSGNLEQIFQDENEDFYSNFMTVVLLIYDSYFPLVRVSRKRWNDKQREHHFVGLDMTPRDFCTLNTGITDIEKVKEVE